MVALTILQLTAAAGDAQRVLAEADLDVRVLKGLATGPLDYPTGWTRHTGDVDLLCRPEEFAEAVKMLRSAGSTNRKVGTPVDLLVEETLVTPEGVELDLHHRLFRFGPSGESLLFDRPVELPDGIGSAMSREARLVHAAGHLLLSPPGTRRLSSLLDVAVIGNSESLDESKVAAIADEFGVTDLVEFATWLGEAIGNEDPPPEPDRQFSLINAAHIRTDRSVPLETLALLRDHRSVSRQVRYVAYQARRALGR